MRRSPGSKQGQPMTGQISSASASAPIAWQLSCCRRLPKLRRPNEVTARLETLKAEIARLEARAADDRADFERERERADRLTVELLQATAETMAANEVTARLEDEVAALRTGGRGGRTAKDKLHADWDI